MYAGRRPLSKTCHSFEGVGRGHVARTWVPGLLPARVHPATAVGVGTGIDGILEHVLQRHPVWLAPLELALCLTFAKADAQLQAVLDEVVQQAFRVPSSSNLRKTKATTCCTSSSGSKTTSPEGSLT